MNGDFQFRVGPMALRISQDGFGPVLAFPFPWTQKSLNSRPRGPSAKLTLGFQ